LLQEATKYEHVFASSLLERIRHFEQWLGSVEESTIVIVGHAQYFKKMMKHSSNIHNCDVWRTHCTFTHNVSSSNDGSDHSASHAPSSPPLSVTAKWGDPALQFRSPFSYQHPMNRFSFLYSDSSTDTPAATVAATTTANSDNRSDSNEDTDEKNEDNENEVTCRICQMTVSESSPEEVFIRPCKCSGTLSHVHISCLNEWRATSSTAAYKCYVCNYTYRIERTSLSHFLMSEGGTNVISVLLISLATLCLGVGGICVSKYVFGVDVCWEICRLAQWRMWWRNCSFSRLPDSLHTFFSFWTELIWQRSIDDVRAIVLCHTFTVMLNEILLVGCALLGVCGVMAFLLNDGYDIYQSFGHGYYDWQSLAYIVCWFASLGSANMSRLSIWLGYAVSCRSSYYKIRKIGKNVAQAIGENILEPNN
jgi:hypothetical protein